jgi:type IV fimbrial biogenesis protein FimT
MRTEPYVYPSMPRRAQRARAAAGFTLMEFLTTLAVVGIVAALAVPNMRPFIQNNRLTSASNDLLRSFQLARTEAIKRQQNVVVCASADPTAANPTCNYGTFNGWIVFQDTNSNWQADAGEAVLEQHALLDSTITVKQDKDRDAIESYAPSGFANPAGAKNPTRNVLICDVRGNKVTGAQSVERALLVTATGRVRVSRLSTDITNAEGTVGQCP